MEVVFYSLLDLGHIVIRVRQRTKASWYSPPQWNKSKLEICNKDNANWRKGDGGCEHPLEHLFLRIVSLCREVFYVEQLQNIKP